MWQEGNWTRERKDRARALFLSGYSAAEVANELGNTSRNAVTGMLWRLGVRRGVEPSAKSRRMRIVHQESTANVVKRINVRRATLQPDAAPAVEEIPVSSEFLSIPFLDLERGMCRYPQGEGLDMVFCGQPQIEESSYCANCHQVTHSPTRFLNISSAERARRRRQGRRNRERAA